MRRGDESADERGEPTEAIAAHHPSRGASGPTSINPPVNLGGTNGHSVAQTCERIPCGNTTLTLITNGRTSEENVRTGIVHMR